jgi:hypothetical protein
MGLRRARSALPNLFFFVEDEFVDQILRDQKAEAPGADAVRHPAQHVRGDGLPQREALAGRRSS